MDLKSTDTAAQSEKGAVMVVRHPATGEELRHDDGHPMTITVAGMASRRYRRKSQEITNRRLGSNRMRGTAQQLENDSVELITACTISWDIQLGGQVPPSEEAEYRKVYANPGLRWLRDQVDNYIGEPGNFMEPTTEGEIT